MGQCNDAYSAIKIALGAGGGVRVRRQRPAAVADALVVRAEGGGGAADAAGLGIKGIRLGPTLPAFLTPTLLAVLQEKFDLRANGEAAADVARALGQAA